MSNVTVTVPDCGDCGSLTGTYSGIYFQLPVEFTGETQSYTPTDGSNDTLLTLDINNNAKLLKREELMANTDKDLVPQVNADSVIQVDGNNHCDWIMTTAPSSAGTQIVVAVDRAVGTLNDGVSAGTTEGATIIFTNDSDLPLTFQPIDETVRIISPASLEAYTRGSSVALVAFDEYTWVLMGDIKPNDVEDTGEGGGDEDLPSFPVNMDAIRTDANIDLDPLYPEIIVIHVDENTAGLLNEDFYPWPEGSDYAANGGMQYFIEVVEEPETLGASVGVFDGTALGSVPLLFDTWIQGGTFASITVKLVDGLGNDFGPTDTRAKIKITVSTSGDDSDATSYLFPLTFTTNG